MPQDSTSLPCLTSGTALAGTAGAIDGTDTSSPANAAGREPQPAYVFTPEEEAAFEGEDEQYREYQRARKARASRVLKDDLTRRIDHILYTEWDPIGVHLLSDFNCFDEYHRYLPGIVQMLREDASIKELSDELLEVESFMLGPDTVRRRCDVIAVMITQYGPHAAKHPFVPVINTQTPQAAYQSVLDLVTQTRVDAYEKRWEAVCRGYEEAVRICRQYLPRRSMLIGSCLNNLGHACAMAGKLEQARAALEEAAARLKPGEYTRSKTYAMAWEQRLYGWCLNNLINLLEYRGERAAAISRARTLVAHSARRYGKRSGQAWDARQRLGRLILREQVPVRLACTRISVEQDSCGSIGSSILID